MPSCLLVNTEEDNGSTSSDSDGEILKQFEISASRSQNFRAQASVRRERPGSVQARSIDQEQERVGSELSDREGVPAKLSFLPRCFLISLLRTDRVSFSFSD